MLLCFCSNRLKIKKIIWLSFCFIGSGSAPKTPGKTALAKLQKRCFALIVLVCGKKWVKVGQCGNFLGEIISIGVAARGC